MTAALSRFLMPLCFLCLFSLNSYAETKPNLVLLPLDVSQVDIELESEYGSALQHGLKERYNVFYGAAVERELEKEYSKIDCNAETCQQNVALAFNGELIADASVKKVAGGYILKLVIRNVLTGEVLESPAVACNGCGSLSVITRLGLVGSGKAQLSLQSSAQFVAPNITGPAQGSIELISAEISGDTTSNVAMLVLDSQPSGADVFLGGIKAGVTPYQNFGLQAGQSLQITLKKENYHDKNIKVSVKGGVNKLPKQSMAPAFGRLKITSQPSGAEVYLAGQKVGVTPFYSKQQASGNYGLSVRHRDYHVVNERVNVRDGVLSEQSVELKPAFGSLNISSSPSGAEVYLAGQKVGATPFVREKQTSGNYYLSLRTPLHQSIANELITVSDGEQTTKHFRLNTDYGELKINAGTYNSRVTIQAQKTSQSDRANSKKFRDIEQVLPLDLKLKPGEYQVSIRKQGHDTKSFKVVLANGEVQTLTRNQTKLRQQTGNLIVSTKPYSDGAKVYANGAYKGEVPLMLTLPIGEYLIEIKHKGAKGKQKVNVLDGKDETLTLTLVAENISRPKNLAKKKQASKVSINTARNKKVVSKEGSTEVEGNADDKSRNHRVFSIARTHYENYESFSDLIVMFLTVYPTIGLPTDITSLPTGTSYELSNKSEKVSATLRPSKWAKPNSMIAKASKLQQEIKLELNDETSKNVSSTDSPMKFALAASN